MFFAKHSLPKNQVMYKWIISVLLCLLTFQSQSQNLIPNPSFENGTEITDRWSGIFTTFNNRIKLWNSPTQGSPDILHVDNVEIMRPKRPGLDLKGYTPRTGEFMLGMKTYGCASGVTHCKEYIQIKSLIPLVAGEDYRVSFWIKPVNTSIKVNSFGVALSDTLVQDRWVTELLEIPPVFEQNELIASDSAWYEVAGVFTAPMDCDYVIFGNFRADEETEFKLETDGLDYSFYLIDDVSLEPVNPPAFVQQFNSDEPMELKNVLFDFDQAILKEESFEELGLVYTYLMLNPGYQLLVMGHADSTGDKKYNQNLSEKRANTIKEYLMEKGIAEDRIAVIGYGSDFPVKDGRKRENKRESRRVEVLFQR